MTGGIWDLCRLRVHVGPPADGSAIGSLISQALETNEAKFKGVSKVVADAELGVDVVVEPVEEGVGLVAKEHVGANLDGRIAAMRWAIGRM